LGTPPEDDAGAGEGAPAAENDPAKKRGSLASRIDAFMSGEADLDDDIPIDEDRPRRPQSAPSIHPGSIEPIIPTRPQSEPGVEVDVESLDEVEEIVESKPIAKPPVAPPSFRPPAIPRPGAPPPPPPRVAIPPIGKIPTPGKPPAIPLPRASQPGVVSIPAMPRTKPPTAPPQPPPRPSVVTKAFVEEPDAKVSADDVLSGGSDISQIDGGVEVGTETPDIVEDQPLEAHLESPTVVDRAIAALGDAGGEARAEELDREVEAKLLDDPAAAAYTAYELGEVFERRLADEARAVKAYGRALNLDPSLRPNLWAIRRVFYRRGLWPNLQKLVDAEVAYARDDYERADLLLEKARVSAHRLSDNDDARTALTEAMTIAPQHQGVLLELERVVAKSGDVPALLDVWDRLAEAVEQPARKISYHLEVARACASSDFARAQDALGKAAALATGTPAAERVARETLRIVEEHGEPSDVAAAIDALASVLLAAFGPAGPSAEATTEKAARIRLEVVALKRRQAQLARAESGDKAWEYLQQALALSPGEAILLADLTELAEELGRYEDLAELVQNWQAVEGDPARAMSLSIRRADALLRGGQRDQARALLASLEAMAPGFVVLTSAAERDALAGKDPAALAATYSSAAQAALLGTWLGPGQEPKPDPTAAATLFVQAAELLAYEVATPEAIDEARTLLGKALEARSEHVAALEALIELDDVTGNLADGLGRLRTAIERNQDPTDRRALIERAIRLARSHGDLESVLTFEQQLVEMAPSELALRWRLESTLSQLGRDDERADLLVKLAADETDATGRGTALLTAARLRERAGAVENATELYRQVLALWPDDTFARESLLDLLRAQERWQELVAERRAEAKALPDGPAARRALREAAWVLEVRADDAAQAAQVYEELTVRFPDDASALEGLARCRGKFGDRTGEANARRTVAETNPSANTVWLQARSLERAAQLDEAADQYRSLIESETASVAATNATFALADLAASRADTVMRVEATAALAGRTADARLGAALAEDSGWMYALVLEDFERAAQSFEAAIALEPTRRGAHLGAALVAARNGDAPRLAQAYEDLAANTSMVDASAALLLRAAAMAAANNDLALADQRVALARNAAPDDASALLVVAETSTQPVVEANDAFAAVDPLLARAEVLEMRSALADDPAARASWELDRAESLELAGRMREAGAVVAAVLKTRPDDLRALSALRRMADRVGDKATAASAAYSLSRLIGDRQARLELLRDAASIFDGPGLPHNTEYAISAFKRILMVDPGAREFERLLELLRERADVRTLINVISDRLAWHEAEGHASDTTVPLLLERATVRHGLGDTEAAVTDLDVLLERSPAHVEALRFRADLAFNNGDVQSAVSLWRRYLQAETRPNRKREIELQLSQVLAENTNDIGGAIEQLERVVNANADDVQLRERLLGLCLRANDWERAVRELRAIARMRPTPQDKAREELRLGLMLRDKLGDRAGARQTLDRARTLDPLNLDVVRELSELLDPAQRAQVLAATAENFRAAIRETPSRGPLYEKLAQVNAWQADVDARWIALVAVEALATAQADQRQVIAQGRASLKGPTRTKLDDLSRKSLRGDLGGALHDVWRAIAPAVQVATGVDVGKLGFGRGDRLAVKKLGDKYEPLATALAAFGIEDVDVYINAGRTGFARALAAETPIVCVGADVAAASTPQNRFLLGRTVATVAEGVASLSELRDTELAWTVAAALRAVDAQVPAGLGEQVVSDDTSIAERAKIFKKELSRKAKQIIVQLAATRAADLADVEGFKRAALAVRQRAGLLWASDLAVALSILDVGKGGRALVDSPAALDLAAWSVSDDHLRLREKLGLSLKGSRS
jgi:Tfp pilus assembly protein PilF